MKTLEVTATATVGVEEENQEELLDEISHELNQTVWEFDVEAEEVGEVKEE